MQVKITYMLSETAQRAAMAATGQPVARTQTIEAEAALSDLDLFAIGPDGTVTLDMSVPSHRHLNALVTGWSSSPLLWGAVQTYESLVAAIRAAYAARAAAAEAAAAKEAAKLAAEADYDPALAASLGALQIVGVKDRVRRSPTAAPVHPHALSVPSHQPLTRNALAAYHARAAAQRDERTAAAAAGEAAKLAAIAAWVAEHGTPLQQSRHKDGMLPRAEATELMAAWVMESHGVPAEDDRQICTDGSCPCSESEITALPECAYTAWVSLRKGLPDGYTVSFQRVKECPSRNEWGDCDADAVGCHTAAYLTIPYGPFRFERQVVLA
jgi:hypothetical protein